MYKSHATSVNYPGQMYRALDTYYGVMPGQVGTVTSASGETLSIPVPAFAPPMNEQSVPQGHVGYIGTPSDLQHGLSADQLTSGYFGVNNAYPQTCCTFRKRKCDGTVPCNTIPINDQVNCDLPVKPVLPPIPTQRVAGMGQECGGGMAGAAVCHSGLICAGEGMGRPGTCVVRVDPAPSPAVPTRMVVGLGEQCGGGMNGGAMCSSGLTCVPNSSGDIGGPGVCMMSAHVNPTPVQPIPTPVQPIPTPVQPIPTPTHYAGGIGDMCTTGVMGSCQQGLVCVNQDSGDPTMAGASGRCMMPFPDSGDHRHS